MIEHLKIRLRSDLKDLNDEEFEAYLSTMDLDSNQDLLKKIKIIQSSSLPRKKYTKTYKTVTIRGVKKRIPVGHYVEEVQKEVDDLPLGDGSQFLATQIGFNKEVCLIEQMESCDECFNILIGFTKVGDLVEVDDKWGVVCEINGDSFKMLHGCGTLLEVEHKLYEINQNYRMIGE
jgi:hypothetical protein